MEQAAEADVAWVCGPDGLEHLDRVAADLAAGADVLAVASRLRAEGIAPGRCAVLLDAAETRQRAEGAGYPGADRLVLLRAALEQASAPAVALHRARRLADGSPTAGVVDLCCGAGLDAAAIAGQAGPVDAVDLDPVRVVLARHTARVLDAAVTVHLGDALHPPVGVAGRLVHVDPSRRDDLGRRARTLAQHGPPVGALTAALADAAGAGIVVAPGVALDDPDLPSDAEVEFVAVDGALTEATLWTGVLRGHGPHGPVRARATDVATGATLARTGDPVDLPVGPVGSVLVEVSPAAVRARLHGTLGEEVDARRIARRSALLSADHPVAASPWWRVEVVEAVLSARAREVRRWLRTAAPAPVEVSTHGLEVDVGAFWRALGSPQRGPQGRRLRLVRLDDRSVCVATRPDGRVLPDHGSTTDPAGT